MALSHASQQGCDTDGTETLLRPKRWLVLAFLNLASFEDDAEEQTGNVDCTLPL